VRKKSHTPGFDPRTAQPVASLYTDYAIPAQQNFGKTYKTAYLLQTRADTLNPANTQQNDAAQTAGRISVVK